MYEHEPSSGALAGLQLRDSTRRPSVDPNCTESAPGSGLNFDVLFRDYYRYVAKLGVQFLGSSNAVDDFAQDVFLDVYRGLESLRDESRVKPWIRQIAIRRAFKHLRRRKLRRTLRLDGASEAIDAGRVVNQPQQEHLTLVKQVEAALTRCTAEERMIWVLRHVEGETVETIAALTKRGRSTVKRRLASAQTKVERRLR